MSRPAETQNGDCAGPSFGEGGDLSPACKACGRCDAINQLVRSLAPLAQNIQPTAAPVRHTA